MKIEFIESIQLISAAQWNRLCPSDYPFVRHEFLAALEDSGSVGADKGWQPLHLLGFVEERLVLAAPGYCKTHSYGEYGSLY